MTRYHNNQLSKRLIQDAAKYGISEDLIQKNLSKGKLIQVKRNEILLNIGEQNNYIYFILEGGFISQYYNEESSKYRTIAFYIDNYQPYMTEPESFFTNSISNCQLKAYKKSKLIAFHRESITSLNNEYKNFDKYYNAKILQALIIEGQMKTKLISLSKKNLYSYLITEHNAVTRNVPSKYIAEFIGVTPQWLSKIKKSI
ncbi:cAMP-binding domain of CRP or a regulatory subunit of cAMP-dependent protein kinases [Mesonia phycicola]|uniref:cAMP-binding domain of CRP or a regulatory subunit of cAMP-dependent protein kinases n=1 Tax=Mesonia phycicola TaxID=579105 RepID=A0A1M6A1M5_9FLAO|nr:Crp/Fnr family transcriptional regulator [Mesonia phycicola]SHI30336.1 cAMP-binding domain of CRP or a regulatory subunit of cAMP-dependent protein kinases [Mesonia phycicola]